METNGLLDSVTTIHCICIYDTEGKGEIEQYADHEFKGRTGAILEGVRRLREGGSLCGHNILRYDLPVLKKLYPDFTHTPVIADTLILTRLLFTETGEDDDKLIKQKKLPAKYRGLHKLEAWGYRLGVMKGEYDGGWEEWNADMQRYCVQDVVVTKRLLEHCRTKPWPTEAIEIENGIAPILVRQEMRGFCFDEPAALELLKTLSKEKLKLADELRARFGWWWSRDGARPVEPKRDNAKYHYAAGAPFTKVKRVSFNPASRDHIARVLIKEFGWSPETLTSTGKAEVSEESLRNIRHPEAKSLIQYLTVDKRLGQLADGKEAWLKHVRNGAIHGGVNQLGTVTGRMSHSYPNLGQVPATHSPYGKECRSLFRARPGYVLVGIDASGLEARNLGHFMALYDDGAYAKTVVEGKKEDGSDVHSVNMKALGITSRDDAKTWFYAYIYGAGDGKLGKIITKVQAQKKNAALGKKLRASFEKNLPAMGTLIAKIKSRAKVYKRLKGLDGRMLYVRSEHSAPNTLLQSAGAVVMKKALLILDNKLQSYGLRPGEEYEFVANVHDEWQIECRPEVAQEVGRMGVEAIREAGRHFRFRCPLDGEFNVGPTWADTH